MNIRNIEYNFEENNTVSVYENSNYVIIDNFRGNVLEFNTTRLTESYGGSFEYNPSILDIKFLIYK